MFMTSLRQASGISMEEMDSLDTITAELLNFLRLKNQRLYLHSVQVANYSMSIAANLSLPKSEIEQLKYAGLLHDIGLLFISNTLLAKMPYLNKTETAQYKRHAAGGANLLETIPCCQDIVPYIHYHHENWDGTGFPKHLRGTNIPLGGRIIAIADYYDRIINPSSEFWAKTKKQAVHELFRVSGQRFDPEIVRAFIETL